MAGAGNPATTDQLESKFKIQHEFHITSNIRIKLYALKVVMQSGRFFFNFWIYSFYACIPR